MKPIIYKYNFFRKPQAERKQPVLSSSAIWCAPLRDVRLSCWRWWRRSRKRQRNGRKSSFKSCSRKSLSSRWETLSWIISYTLRITSSSYRSVSLCLLTSQDNTHTAHAEGFPLSCCRLIHPCAVLHTPGTGLRSVWTLMWVWRLWGELWLSCRKH